MISLTNSQIGELMGQFLLAGTGTLSFAILFACPRRSLPTCALVGAMGWFVYEPVSYTHLTLPTILLV